MTPECLNDGHTGDATENGHHVCDRCEMHAYQDCAESLAESDRYGFSYHDAGKGNPIGFVVSLDGKVVPYWNLDEAQHSIVSMVEHGKNVWGSKVGGPTI